MGQKNFGIDSTLLEKYSKEIKEIHKKGIEIAIVIGGGNIYRGIESEESGINRVQGDYMGMLATIINGKIKMKNGKILGEPEGKPLEFN